MTIPPIAPSHAHDAAVRGAHVVTFHESTEGLILSIADYISSALRLGGSAVVIAEASRWDPVRARLEDAGVDTDEAVRDGRLQLIGARELLDRITRKGEVDAALFHEHVGAVLDTAAAFSGRIAAFGEMVALAYEDGDVLLAIAIEELWNDLQEKRPFDLLCGYPTMLVEHDEHTETFRAICEAHNGVASPAARLTDEATQRLRVFAQLSQERAEATREESHLRSALDLLVELDRQRREFTAMVVHDIRSPNSIVENVLRLLRDGRADLSEAEVTDLLDRAMAQSRRIDRLADDILTMSRLDAGEFTYELTEFDLGALLEAAIGELVNAGDLDVALVRPERELRVCADEGRQVQILENLLSNAVKFSDGQHVRIEVSESPDGVSVAVADRGPGMAPEVVETLFRPFSRASDQRRRGGKSGTGLGLHITRALVEGQGGTIRVESEPGDGSCFTYTVPAPSQD